MSTVRVVGLRGAVLPLLLALFAACAPAAEDAGRPAKDAAQGGGAAAAPGVEAMALAAGLAQQGTRGSSPLQLLAAAQLLIDAAPQPLGVEVESSAGTATDSSAKSGSPVALDAAALIAAARAMAGPDTAVTTLADRLTASLEAGKGAIGGPRYANSSVNAGSIDTYRIAFRGGERASVRIRGDGDTDLDCYVYSSGGILMAVDDDYTDYCILDWWPSGAETFRIEIHNLGRVYNVYSLTTN